MNAQIRTMSQTIDIPAKLLNVSELADQAMADIQKDIPKGPEMLALIERNIQNFNVNVTQQRPWPVQSPVKCTRPWSG